MSSGDKRVGQGYIPEEKLQDARERYKRGLHRYLSSKKSELKEYNIPVPNAIGKVYDKDGNVVGHITYKKKEK